MAIWVEIHCDSQTAGAGAVGTPLCYGMNGNQPGGMVRIASNVPGVLRGLHKHALESGWQFLRGKWTYPACIKATSN